MSGHKNKYCCENFSSLHKQPVSSDCIRIVSIKSFKPDYLKIRYAYPDTGRFRFVKWSNVPYRFFIMPPLLPPSLVYSKLSGGHMISFCPFCGVNLFDFYVRKRNIFEYINVEENESII